MAPTPAAAPTIPAAPSPSDFASGAVHAGGPAVSQVPAAQGQKANSPVSDEQALEQTSQALEQAGPGNAQASAKVLDNLFEGQGTLKAASAFKALKRKGYTVMGRFEQSPRGWKARQEHSRLEPLKEALHFLGHQGLHLRIKKITVVGREENQGPSSLEHLLQYTVDGHLIIHENALKYLGQLARQQGVLSKDKASQMLIYAHARFGLPQTLRFTREKLRELGFAPHYPMTALRASETFNISLRDKIVLLLSLMPVERQRGLFVHDLHRAYWAGINSIAVSPDGEWVASVDVAHRLRIFQVRAQRELELALPTEFMFSREVAFSPDGRWLAVIRSGFQMVIWDLNNRGMRPPTRVFSLEDLRPSPPVFSKDGKKVAVADGAGIKIWDVETRALIDGNERIWRNGIDRRKILFFSSDDSTLYAVGSDQNIIAWNLREGKEFHRFVLDSDQDHRPSSRAVLPERDWIASGKADGRITIENVKTGEKLAEFQGPEGSAALLAFSPDGRYLASAASAPKAGSKIRLWDIKDQKQIFSVPAPSEQGISALAFSPYEGRMLYFASHGIVYFWPIPDPAKRASHDQELSLQMASIRDLARFAPALKGYLLKDLVAMAGVLAPNSLQEAFFSTLAEYVYSRSPLDPEVSHLRRARGSSQWFRDCENEINSRMPSLGMALRSSIRLGRLLFVQSLMRLAYPYELANNSEKTPLAWAKGTGIEFALRELLIASVNETFRRAIYSAENDGGIFSAQLKMSGQRTDKRMIPESHFSVSRELWQENPQGPGTLMPMHFAQFYGWASLYGDIYRYQPEKEEPLGIMLYRHEEGKRYWNADALIRHIARESGRTEEQVRVRILSDAAVAAIRLHRLGWKGDTDWGNDMHGENILVLPNGRGKLVGDFGAFERAPLDMAARSRETLNLLGNVDGPLLLAIYDQVVGRLTAGLPSEEERKLVAEEVRQELDLPLLIVICRP